MNAGYPPPQPGMPAVNRNFNQPGYPGSQPGQFPQQQQPAGD